MEEVVMLRLKSCGVMLSLAFLLYVNFGFLSQSNNHDRKAHIVGQYGY